MHRKLVVIAAALLAQAGLAAGQPGPPFPSPESDVACAFGTHGEQVEAAVVGLQNKKGNPADWDQIPECGKKHARWDELSCGRVCRVTLNDLRPTQRSIGVEAVNCKANKISKKLKKKAYGDYFKSGKRVVPVIIGPNGKFYVTDHHHLSNAVYRAELPSDSLKGIEGADDWDKNPNRRELLVYVLFNLTPDYLQATQAVPQGQGYGMNDFIASMNTYSGGAQSDWCAKTAKGERVVLTGVGLTWPCDAQGKPISFSEIAYAGEKKERKIWDLTDDPYRSMARWVRNAYGYVKCGDDDPSLRGFPDCQATGSGNPAFFMEFQWADFLRAHFMQEAPAAHEILTSTLPPGRGQLAAISRYLPFGMQVAESSAAIDMIGFNNGRVEAVRPHAFPAFGIAQDECELEQSLDDLGAEMGWSGADN